MSEICMAYAEPSMITSGAHGIKTPAMMAVMINNPGARINRNLLETFGMISSFHNIFPPSARGCNNPHLPALLGPQRSCSNPANFLSHHVEYAAIPSDTAKTSTHTIDL